MAAMKLSSRQKSLLLLVLILLCLGIVVWCGHYSAGPEGVYYDNFIGSSEPTYWIFQDGRVWLHEKGTADRPAGVFVRSNHVWVLLGDSNAPVTILKPTPWGLRMTSVPGSGMNKYLPRKGFSWLKSGESYDLRVQPGVK
jgi:hypothetical protein